MGGAVEEGAVDPRGRRRGRVGRTDVGRRPLWWGLGRDLAAGALVGLIVGVLFDDIAFGAGVGAAIGGLFHVYFRLR